MDDTFETPSGSPQPSRHAESVGKAAPRLRPRADMRTDVQRIAYCKKFLEAITGPDAQVKELRIDERSGLVISIPISSPGIMKTEAKELKDGIAPEQTKLARACRDFSMFLADYYGTSAEEARKSKAITFAHNKGADENLADDDFIGKHSHAAYEWLGFWGGYEPENSDENTKRIWLYWPHVADREELIGRLRADKKDLLHALDRGGFQIAAAAENLGHGHGSLGYGRA